MPTSPRLRFVMCVSSEGGESERAGAFKSHLERDLAVMLAAVFEARDLERAFDAAEIRHDDLVAADLAVEEDLAHKGVRAGVLEDPGARQRGAPNAGPGQKLAPGP